MQLVLVAHRSRAALQIGDIAVVVGHDKRAFKLSCIAGIDAEVAAQLHRAAHALGNIYKRAVAEHSAVQCGVEIVAIGHDGAKILAHQVAVLFHSLAYGTEDNAFFAQLLLERCLHRHAVHDGVDGGVAAQGQAFFEGNAQLVESLHQFWVNSPPYGPRGGFYSIAMKRRVYSAPPGGRKGGFLCRWVSIVADGLIVDRRHVHVSPSGLLLRAPVAESLQAEVEEPLRLTFLLRDEAHHVLVQACRDDLGVDVGGEAVLVFLLGNAAHQLIVG